MFFYIQVTSSIGRAAVSKTAGWGFKSLVTCIFLYAMYLPIQKITFDATAFNADHTLVTLLKATSTYNELSPKKIFPDKQHYSTPIDSKRNSILKEKLLKFFSLAQKHIYPLALFTTIQTNNEIDIPKNIFPRFPVYPFIVTAGIQFETWRTRLEILTHQYFASITGMWICNTCVQKVAHTIGVGDSYYVIYPGSCNDIPVEYTHSIYSLMRKEAMQCHITLNDEYMFTPLHTVAGFIVEGKSMTQCQTCTIPCPFQNLLT